MNLKELDELCALAKKYMWCDEKTQKYIQDKGVIIEPNRFYSQLSSVADVNNSYEYDEKFMPNGPYWDETVFNLDALDKFYEENKNIADNFKPPLNGDKDNPSEYFWNNPAFSFLDSISYYCMIKSKKPNKIIEIGSGFSTLLAKKAIKENESGELLCIEPFPMAWLDGLLDEKEIIREKIQDIGVNFLNKNLSNGDILFIDSTHTVKIGSDCTFIYLKALPSINKDIYVHVHDVFLPFAYSKASAINNRVQWVEQYLLMAYMMDNPRVEFVFSSKIAQEFKKEKFDDFINHQKPSGGGSIWFKQSARYC